MPVVAPSLTSTGTVNGVPWRAVFSVTICGRRSSSRRPPGNGMHTKPPACFAMKLMCSGVTASAATIRSPSFSRSASSTTMSALPNFRSATPSSIVLIAMAFSLGLLFRSSPQLPGGGLRRPFR